MKVEELLAAITLTPELRRTVNSLQSRMLGQARQSVAKMSGLSERDAVRIYELSGLTKDQVESVCKDYPGGGYVVANPFYNLLMFVSIRAYRDLDERLAYDSAILLSLVMAARIRYKYMQICDEVTMNKAISLMSKKTYIATNGIVWAIYKISYDTFNKYKDQLVKNPNDLYYRYRYIVDLRNKFNQLFKHIARMYYYVVAHKAELKDDSIFDNKAQNVITYISNHDLPSDIIEQVAMYGKCTPDLVYDFHHALQIDSTLQDRFFGILRLLIKRLDQIQDVLKEQQIEYNLSSREFLKNFYVNSRRSSTLVSVSSDAYFTERHYNPELVLAFACVCILHVSHIENLDKTQNEYIPDDPTIPRGSGDYEMPVSYDQSYVDRLMNEDCCDYFSDLISLPSEEVDLA